MKAKLLVPLLILLGFLAGCQDEGEDPAPIDQFKTELSGDLNSQALSIVESGIQTIYFSDPGETTGALEIGAQLPNNERLTFFVDEIKNGTVNLSQVFPAVMTASADGLRINPTPGSQEKTQTIPPSFVKYLSSSNTFFALSGTLVFELIGENLTLRWDIKFKNKEGNEFTSKGTVKVKNYKSNTKPKSQINNPASSLSVVTLSPDYGKAGDVVTITGTGFSALKSENLIKLGEVNATVNEASATELKVTVPEAATKGKFKLSVLGATVETAQFFFIPVISQLSNSFAKAGESITIQGNHFDEDKAQLEVKLGEKSLPITSSTYTTITVEIPQGAVTGKIRVARKGKNPVEGPELTIESEPVNQGPPINEIFEVISGNLSFSEVFTNKSEYGPVWSINIDQKNNFLYATTERYLLQINLTNRNVTVIAGPESEVFKEDVPLSGPAYIPPAVFIAPDGTIYGYKNSFAAILSPSNVFKINPETKAVTLIGNAKVDGGASMASMFVDKENNLYFNEFASGYHVNSYNSSLQGKKQLIQNMTGELVAGFVPTGESSFRVVRGLLLGNNDKILYHDVAGNQAGSVTDWSAAVAGLRSSVAHSTPTLIGFGFAGGNYHGFTTAIRQDDNRPYVQFPKLVYTIGVQNGGQGNFIKKGEFNIIQQFQFQNQTRFVRAAAQSFYRNAYCVDSQGNSYVLIQSPLNPSTGTEIIPGTGGIYKVSY